MLYLFIWRRNIYSEELLKIIHIDQDLEYIKDVDAMSKMDTDQKESTNTVYDQRNGVRCIRLVIIYSIVLFYNEAQVIVSDYI